MVEMLVRTVDHHAGFGQPVVLLLARYAAGDDAEAERCLAQAREDAAEYGILAAQLDLSPAMAVEAFTVCRAQILETAQRWAAETVTHDAEAASELARVGRFFDETLLSMLETLEWQAGQPAAHV